MKWLLLLVVCASGCTESVTPTAPTNPNIPPVANRPDGGMGGAGGGGGGGGQGGSGGIESQGACDNASDLDAIQNSSNTLRDIARDCGAVNNITNCINLVGAAYENCIRGCLQDDLPDLSTECASCYAAAERCSADSFCRANCQFDTCSAPCLSCVNGAGCIDDLEDCTGLPGDGCPG